MSDDENKKTADSSGGYLIAVGSLLLVICAALAVLWMTERSRRVLAEQKTVKLQQYISAILDSGSSPPSKQTTQPARN